MKKLRNISILFVAVLFLLGCTVDKPSGSSEEPEFGGKIARSYAESEEWWPEREVPSKKDGAPNIIIFLLDDTGFGQLGCFGGVINTPNIDKLAENGLRYNDFHTTALCSPSRATIMAGRYPHTIGLGSHSLTAMGFPGYNAMIPENSKSVANHLQESGYVNYALGKWDHTPLYEVSQVGPFDRWPSGEGFDHYFGFMAADAHCFQPVVFQDHQPVEPWVGVDDYFLEKDMADRAIKYITGHKSVKEDLPFMMFWAPVAMHSPHHAPKSYIDAYKGQFDKGWDVVREEIIANQKKLGIIPGNTQLTKRAEAIPAWDDLPEVEKKLYARQMEAFAGQLTHVDEQIGRIVDMLEEIGELDNTLILLTADNGASGEGGLTGTHNETYVLNGLQTPLENNLRHIDEWGSASTYPHYHAGWALAGNTPFQYFKQIVHRGGQSDALIAHWPDVIKEKGAIRTQYHHIADIAPTVLEASGQEFHEVIHGVEQRPFDGVSFMYTFTDGEAEDRRTEQLYELFGNRALYKDGWKAVTIHGNRMPWNTNSVTPFEDDVWELYNLNEDFSEANNLADEYPEKLKEMVERWDELAWEQQVYPLFDDMVMRLSQQQDRLFGDQKEFVYYFPGATRIAEKASAPVKNKAHTIETSLDLQGNEEGVIVACGGFTGGYTLFIKNGKVYYDYNYFDGVYWTMSADLPTGLTDIKFNFIKTGNFEGEGELYINGDLKAEVDMPQMHLSTFSLSETFDLGEDTGTPVSAHYDDHFAFNGDLKKVVITLTD
jgi:arylsulfatase A-like enzyme